MKAMILSAGYGTRLGQLTKDTPKPMLQVHDKPLLEYIVRNLVRQGFDSLAINLHFKPEMIKDYFEDGRRFGARIVYSYENELLGTAGGAKKMEKFLKSSEPFLIHYGDIVTNQDFSSMIALHRRNCALATLLVHQRNHSNSVIVIDDEQRIVRLLERPSEEERKGADSPWINSGICLCEPEVLDYIPANCFCDLPRDVLSGLVGSRRLFASPLTAYRCAIDSPARLHQASLAASVGELG